ncbi:MAG: arylesterase [Woeseiaceae bacterium]|nr:arylesterase [Woeseiaceae bacterium]
MRIILFLTILLVTASTVGAEEPTIVIFGDSLSAGYGIEVDQSWGSLLQARLKEQGYEHRVVNASISGETTEGGVTRIDSALSDFSPDLVILELGGNDGLRGFPPTRIEKNLEKLIVQAKSSGAAVILLGIRIPTNYGSRYSAEFEAVFRNVSERLDVQWVEFFMEGIALNDDLLQEDRIHPNANAQPMLLDNAWSIISTTLQN